MPYHISIILISMGIIYLYWLNGRRTGKFGRLHFANDPQLRWIKKKLAPPTRWKNYLDPYSQEHYPGLEEYSETRPDEPEFVPSFVTSTWQDPLCRRKNSPPECQMGDYVDTYGEIPFELRAGNLPHLTSGKAVRDIDTMLQSSKWRGCRHPSVAEEGVAKKGAAEKGSVADDVFSCLGKYFHQIVDPEDCCHPFVAPACSE